MTVEVTSHDPATDRRSLTDKRCGYAAAGIPVHLLIDRETCTLKVYSVPEGGVYRRRATHSYGAVVELPHPVEIALATEKFKDYSAQHAPRLGKMASAAQRRSP